MSGHGVDTRRIRDVFDEELASYHAPADLGERARAGGLRRARRHRIQRAASLAAACAAVVTGLAVVPLAGTGPSGLPPAAAVGRAMRTAFHAVGRDIVYTRLTSRYHGVVQAEWQDWAWPAQPVTGQRVRMRHVYALRGPGPDKALIPFQDDGLVYRYERPLDSGLLRGAHQGTNGRLTQVCYPSARTCMGDGFPGVQTGDTALENRAGTWSSARVQTVVVSLATIISKGSYFSPGAIAREITAGRWQVVRRAWLDGQPALELLPRGLAAHRNLRWQFWVNARTHLPVRSSSGSGARFSQTDYAYLPPTPANLALLQVRIPRGLPRSSPRFTG